jgi:hypothetical protein
MEVTELRIGNFVEINNKIIIMDTRIFHAVIHGFEGYEPKPIPITEYWILKFGFNKSNRLDLGELKPCYVIFSLAVMIRHSSFFIDWIGGNTEIKYVHQLQNLYFALTGEELTFNY